MKHFFKFFKIIKRVLGSYDEAAQKVRVRKSNRTSKVTKTSEELSEMKESHSKFIKSVIDGLDLSSREFILAV
jgi:hypothetical protein